MKKLAVLVSVLILVLTACGEKKDQAENSNMDATQTKKKRTAKLKDNAVEVNGVKVKVLKTEFRPMGSQEFQKKPLLIIHYAVTNHTDREVTPEAEWVTDFEVFQDSENSQKRLNNGVVMNQKEQEIYQQGQDIIKKGATIESIEAYELEDDKNTVFIKARDITTNEPLGQIKVDLKNK